MDWIEGNQEESHSYQVDNGKLSQDSLGVPLNKASIKTQSIY